MNLRQKRWLELIKDFELVSDYHPRKANVIANELSRKSSVTLAHINTTYIPLLLDMKIMGINMDYDGHEIPRLLYGFYIKAMDWLFS